MQSLFKYERSEMIEGIMIPDHTNMLLNVKDNKMALLMRTIIPGGTEEISSLDLLPPLLLENIFVTVE